MKPNTTWLQASPTIATELAAEWAKRGPAAVCQALGLRSTLQGRTVMIRCLWHEDRTPSCSIGMGPRGSIRVHCFACDFTCDVHSLFAKAHGLELRRSFSRVLRIQSELLGRWDIVEGLDGRGVAVAEPPPAPDSCRAFEPPRTYPDRDDVLDLIASCVNPDRDHEVASWLRSRALVPCEVSVRGLAYALPVGVTLPGWARYGGHSWAETGHRLIIPMYSANGMVTSVRAACVIDAGLPKRLPPRGYRAGGLIMADAMAREMLRARAWPSWAGTKPQVVIAEGEPDWLTAATRTPLGRCPGFAVLGVIAGAWSDDVAATIPDGAHVAVWTHHDGAGDRYARQINESLRGRCQVVRGAP